MSIHTSTSADGKTVTIKIDGRFDFSAHRAFRDSYRQTPGAGNDYVVDMTEAEYMDSCALGMLLMLREHAGGDDASITIQAGADIRKLLSIASFEKLFAIV